jgi:hypothetical protein
MNHRRTSDVTPSGTICEATTNFCQKNIITRQTSKSNQTFERIQEYESPMHPSSSKSVRRDVLRAHILSEKEIKNGTRVASQRTWQKKFRSQSF